MRPTLHQRIEREAYFINQRTGWSADRCWHEAERRVLARSNRTAAGNRTRKCDKRNAGWLFVGQNSFVETSNAH